MTNEQAKSELMQIYMSLSEEKKQALDVLMAQAEKTCDIEKSNFDVRQYKLDTDTAYECGYNAGLQAQADGEYITQSAGDEIRQKNYDLISRQAVLDNLSELNAISFYEAQEDSKEAYYEIRQAIKNLPSVKPQEPTGHWIVHPKGIYAHLICDKCLSNAPYDCRTDYCPNCGAKMVEPQESEE